MKLVIHAGLHKTASTSFQRICEEHRNLLGQCGLYHPENPNEPRHHSSLAWRSYSASMEDLQLFLIKARSDAPPHCHTVLLSGEDFENALIDLGYAQRIEKCAQYAGYTFVTWVFIHRPTDEYVRALYQELARHRLVVDRDLIEHAANERGMFACSTRQHDYLFALDYHRFAGRFKEAVSGPVIDWTLKEFVEGFPGAVLLREILLGHEFERFTELSRVSASAIRENQSPSIASTRRAYVSNALAISIGRPYKALQLLRKRAIYILKRLGL